ncbi:hypothetical protein RSOLAG1IB_02327 [Rhizoctonia solani AG-1 IB]|uniref:Uncharacterized protein n=1 Tax=Thanatephorus cucumeris (strain AG1-IB / isolate 7/3/14) TaxID=1108050 RepID=A0A0B7FL28_THACB|nr:hypothetical protein RSOLAG1IB_02327 [Rhizoctonia solani AG-1 IB]
MVPTNDLRITYFQYLVQKPWRTRVHLILPEYHNTAAHVKYISQPDDGFGKVRVRKYSTLVVLNGFDNSARILSCVGNIGLYEQVWFDCQCT